MTNLMFDLFEELEFGIFNICSEIFNKDDLENFMQKFHPLLDFKDKGFYLAYMILFVTIHTNHGLIVVFVR